MCGMAKNIKKPAPKKVPKSSSPRPVHPAILEIAPYKPGQSSLPGGKKPIKLSSNENPFGASAATLRAMREVLDRQHRYPDGSCGVLRAAIGERHGLNASRIVCGAGSDELLALLAQGYAGAGDEVLYSAHGFLIYPIAAIRVGAKPVAAPEKNLKADVGALLASVTRNTKMVFIANPNNPTGSYLTRTEMKKLREGLPPHVLLVIDAAYAEYVTAEDYSPGNELVDAGENTVVTRTFSKIYGLGGLRLGWAYCPVSVADCLNRLRGPFNVSDMAQAAGAAAIGDTGFEEKTRQHNTMWRERLAAKLEAMGLKVYPSQGNFLLVDFDGTGSGAQDAGKKGKSQITNHESRATAADALLKSSGIIVRRMETYGLPSCLRITIGTAEENSALLAVLKAFCQK